MANIRTWKMVDHRHPTDSRVVVSREIHMEGEFSDDEWFRIQTMFATMRRQGKKPALDEGCIDVDAVPVPPKLHNG